MFPFYGSKKQNDELPLCKDIQWDYINNKPKFVNGSPVWVYGKEAVIAWSYRALQIKRYKNEMYSWNYGQEFENLIGKGYSEQYTKAEITRYIQDALKSPYIKSVEVSNIKLDGSKLNIKCLINSIYGEGEINV